MRRGGLYDRSIRALSAVYVVIGLALLVLTLARGGGPTAVGFLLGILFVAVGVGRIAIQRRIGRDG